MATDSVGRVRLRHSSARMPLFLGSRDGEVEALGELARAVAFANLKLTDRFPFAELRRELPRHRTLGYRVVARGDQGKLLGVVPAPDRSPQSRDAGHATRAGGCFIDEKGVLHIPPVGDGKERVFAKDEYTFVPVLKKSPRSVDRLQSVCECDAFVEEIGLALHANARDYNSVCAALNPSRRSGVGDAADGVPYHANVVCRGLSGFPTNESVRKAQRVVCGVLDGLLADKPDTEPLEAALVGVRVTPRIVPSLLSGTRRDAMQSPRRRRGQIKRVGRYPSPVTTHFLPADGADAFVFGIFLATRERLLHRLFRCKACDRYALSRADRRKPPDYCTRGACRTAAATARRAPGRTNARKRKQNKVDQTAFRKRRNTWAQRRRAVDKAWTALRAAPPGGEPRAKQDVEKAIEAAGKSLPKCFPQPGSDARGAAERFIKDQRARLRRHDGPAT